MSRIKDLTKNTLIITIGRISTQFITFLLLPLYTSLLSTEEYGTVDLITTLVQLIIPITSLMIDQGVFRYLLNCKDEKSIKKIVSNGLLFLIGFNMLFLILYLVIIPFLSSLYKIWIVLILIATCFSNCKRIKKDCRLCSWKLHMFFRNYSIKCIMYCIY